MFSSAYGAPKTVGWPALQGCSGRARQQAQRSQLAHPPKPCCIWPPIPLRNSTFKFPGPAAEGMLSRLQAAHAPLVRASGQALRWCSPGQNVRLLGSQTVDTAPAGEGAATPAAAAVDDASASPCTDLQRQHAAPVPACRGSLAQHVRCLACGGWHAVPAAARAQPPPRSLPLLSTHGGRPCRGLAISLAGDMAIEVRVEMAPRQGGASPCPAFRPLA